MKLRLLNDSCFCVLQGEYVSVNMCVASDGRTLPSVVIYQNSYPARKYTDACPDDWQFMISKSGIRDKA